MLISSSKNNANPHVTVKEIEFVLRINLAKVPQLMKKNVNPKE